MAERPSRLSPSGHSRLQRDDPYSCPVHSLTLVSGVSGTRVRVFAFGESSFFFPSLSLPTYDEIWGLCFFPLLHLSLTQGL